MKTKKAKQRHLKTLLEFYEYLLNQGHTFWACDMTDKEKKRPFYFVQINRTKHMVTCNTCYLLIEKRKEIIRLQKELNIPVWDLRYKLTEDNIEKHMTVSNSNEFNPNYRYL